jgi:hypothetical protein
MSRRLDMTAPNLFDFATSELSQDAFVCWLAAWADPGCRAANEPLHAAGTVFVNRLLEVGRGPKVSEVRSVRVHRQWRDIDVLLVVNGDTAIIVEDKTATKDHSDQLHRYRAAVTAEYPADRTAAVYLKTGDQGNYRSADAAGYGRFLRADFLVVLELGESAGVTSDIFTDFHRRLRRIEAAVQSFRTAPLAEWNSDWSRWKGFYLALQASLGEGDWDTVSNPSGGFVGFWWHWRDDKYLQLENEKLCFKVTVPDEAQRASKWWEWHNALMAECGSIGLKLVKPVRRDGQCMTVAVLDGDYRRAGAGGTLDLESTLAVLRRAEALVDAAAKRLTPAGEVGGIVSPATIAEAT